MVAVDRAAERNTWLLWSMPARGRPRGRANPERKTGRGETDSPATNDLSIAMRLAEPPTPLERVRSA